MADYDLPYGNNTDVEGYRYGPYWEKVYTGVDAAGASQYKERIVLPHQCDVWMIGSKADLELFIKDAQEFIDGLE